MSAREVLKRDFWMDCTELAEHANEGDPCERCEAKADAIIAALTASGFTIKTEPKTVRELQTEIGFLQARLASLVLGDQTKCVSFSANQRDANNDKP